jgi:hypothetical protein
MNMMIICMFILINPGLDRDLNRNYLLKIIFYSRWIRWDEMVLLLPEKDRV